jgi:hypothetical protein
VGVIIGLYPHAVRFSVRCFVEMFVAKLVFKWQLDHVNVSPIPGKPERRIIGIQIIMTTIITMMAAFLFFLASIYNGGGGLNGGTNPGAPIISNCYPIEEI